MVKLWSLELRDRAIAVGVPSETANFSEGKTPPFLPHLGGWTLTKRFSRIRGSNPSKLAQKGKLIVSNSPQALTLSFGGPAVYRIVVQGYITDRDTDYLGQMCPTSRSPRQTILVGPVQDQAELNGLVNTLVERHFGILLVEFLAPGTSLSANYAREN